MKTTGMKYKTLCCGKTKKNIKLPSATFAKRVVKVNDKTSTIIVSVTQYR